MPAPAAKVAPAKPSQEMMRSQWISPRTAVRRMISSDSSAGKGNAELSPQRCPRHNRQKIRKPSRHHRRADDHEVAEGHEVDEERQVPGRFGKSSFRTGSRSRLRRNKADEKWRSPGSMLRRRLLQQRDQRQQDGDRARVCDLPLDVAAISLVWIHARGRIPVR